MVSSLLFIAACLRGSPLLTTRLGLHGSLTPSAVSPHGRDAAPLEPIADSPQNDVGIPVVIGYDTVPGDTRGPLWIKTIASGQGADGRDDPVAIRSVTCLPVYGTVCPDAKPQGQPFIREILDRPYLTGQTMPPDQAVVPFIKPGQTPVQILRESPPVLNTQRCCALRIKTDQKN